MLTACEDAADDATFQRKLRGLKRILEDKASSPVAESELLDVLHELREALRHEYLTTANTCLLRASILIEKMPVRDKRREPMGLIRRIRNSMSRRESAAQDELLSRQESEAGGNVYALERKIAEFSDRRDALMKEQKEKAALCAKLGRDDPQYASVRRQALALQPQIKTLEQQINLYTKTLQNNAQYRAMIQTGRMVRDLEQYQVDLSEAESMLETISENSQDLTESIDAFGDSLGEFDRRLSLATQTSTQDGDTLFDQMILDMQTDSSVKTIDEEIAIPAVDQLEGPMLQNTVQQSERQEADRQEADREEQL